jgi:hypothetical protein
MSLVSFEFVGVYNGLEVELLINKSFANAVKLGFKPVYKSDVQESE